MSNSETQAGARYSADSGIKLRDTRNGAYLDQVEQTEFAAAMQVLEGAGAPNNEAHRSPGSTYMGEDQLRRNDNNIRNGNDKLDVTTLTAPAVFTYPTPAV